MSPKHIENARIEAVFRFLGRIELDLEMNSSEFIGVGNSPIKFAESVSRRLRKISCALLGRHTVFESRNFACCFASQVARRREPFRRIEISGAVSDGT